MLILSIDTSESYCSCALVDTDGGETLACLEEPIGRGHAEHLMPQIRQCMADSRVSMSDLHRIVVAKGPGTFTGLRIGLSVARGFALGLSVPAIGVSSLQAQAASYPSAPIVHTLIKGRGGQVFHQAFSTESGSVPAALSPAVNIDFAEAAEQVEKMGGMMAGSGCGDETVPDHIDAVKLALIGAGLVPQDNPPDPDYLRSADAVKSKAVFTVAAP